MKILHFSKFYPPFFGGIEKVAYDLVEGSLSAGHQVDVLCFSHEGRGSIETDVRGCIIVRSSVFATVASTPLSLGNLFDFIKLIGKEDEYDVIHVHLPNPLANLAIFLARPRAKIVLHWHADIVKQKNLLKIYDPLQQWLLDRADAIIATSPPYVDSSPWLSKHADKVTVIPIGADVSMMPVNSLRIQEIRSYYGGRKIVFALGRLVYYKGFESLVSAATYLSDDVVVIIGGVGELEEDLKGQILAAGLENKVYLIGSIPFSCLGAYFNACDVFCLPSVERSEAYGVVQLEAMYFGKPLVSTDIPGSGVSWVNSNGVSGLVVPPRDPVALGEALNRILEDDVLRKELSDGSRKRYEDLFLVDRMVEATLGLYKTII